MVRGYIRQKAHETMKIRPSRNWPETRFLNLIYKLFKHIGAA